MSGKTDGPRVTVKMSCFDCRHEHSESYRIQGDSGHVVSCRHPDVNEGALRRIGDTTWDTPEWCPLRPATLRAQLAASDAECAMLRTALSDCFERSVTLREALANVGAERDHAQWKCGEAFDDAVEQEAKRQALKAERDALRALLREAKSFVDGDCLNVHGRIDAALKERP